MDEISIPDENNKLLVFEVDNELYGIELKYIKEILGLKPFTEIPDNPNYVMGIINLRNEIITLIDFRRRLNKNFLEYNGKECILIIKPDNYYIGLIIDRISDFLSIDSDLILKAEKCKNKFIKGRVTINDKSICVLDCSKL